MKDLAEAALNAAKRKGASYADVRLDERVQQDVTVKNGQLAAVSDDASEGVGVRVLVDGAWGFAGSARLDIDEVHEVVDRAIRIARASARARSTPVDLGPPVTSRGQYKTPVERDPFSVPLTEKVELLLRADQAMASAKGVSIREGSMEFIKQKKIFASTEGAYTEQELYESGAGIEATATSPDDVQNRSYPNSFGRHQGAGATVLSHQRRSLRRLFDFARDGQCARATKQRHDARRRLESDSTYPDDEREPPAG